ncbi:hypothetical protein CEXT_354811 [Caerostris extrusa]|uniref:Uncharacterized protein n=1 Tax=Caerostris extrusa TaxID=172846 RepID=A0AAV4SAI6_CAEEX|nr:hypothetical protein CEXT_354811 [Caerostris extrusa]
MCQYLSSEDFVGDFSSVTVLLRVILGFGEGASFSGFPPDCRLKYVSGAKPISEMHTTGLEHDVNQSIKRPINQRTRIKPLFRHH